MDSPEERSITPGKEGVQDRQPDAPAPASATGAFVENDLTPPVVHVDEEPAQAAGTTVPESPTTRHEDPAGEGKPTGEQTDAQTEVPAEDIQITEHEMTPEVTAELDHGTRIEQVRNFVNVIGEYKTSLNAIAEIPSLPTDIDAKLGAILTNPDDPTNAEDIYKWYVKNFGGPARLLKDVLHKDQLPALHAMVARNVAEFRNAASNVDRTQRHTELNTQMTDMASFLMSESKDFEEIQKVFDKEQLSLDQPTWEDNEAVLNVIQMVAEADEEISLLPKGEMEASIKSWISQMATEARSGIPTAEGTMKRRKIYETPHYLDLLDKLKQMGMRRNGVGGVILYGPPGTGKTELIKEKNRREGFDTKVINIHKYIGFGDLFGERAARIAADPGVALATKLNIVIDHTENLSADDFGTSMTDLFKELQSQDNAPDSLGEFLVANVSLSDEVTDILSKDALDADDWGKVKEAYISKQRTRLARTNLPESMQERPEEIIRGEILLALKRSKDTGKPVRVLLDEIDKAGAGSLGGMLTFLSQSPGETIDFGGVTEEIPSWFRVDATSNDSELNAYLTDRFEGLQVDTPPAKDQLMIAAVRLSDTEGNILLNGYEQEQLGVFFVHVLPHVNDLLINAGHPPISNRLVQELTSKLVDYTNMNRTATPMSEALHSLIIDNRFWKNDTALANQLDSLLTGREFGSAMSDKPRPQGLRARFQRPAAADEAQTLAPENEPLLRTIAGLVEASDDYSFAIEELLLTDDQQEVIHEADVEEQARLARKTAERMVLKTGHMVKVSVGEEGTEVSLISTRPGEKAQRLVTRRLTTVGRLADGSADGRYVVLTAEREDAQHVIIVGPNSSGDKFDSVNSDSGAEIRMDESGQFIGSLSPDGTIKVFKNTGGNYILGIKGAEGFQFAPDGKTILVKGRGTNTSRLFSTRTGAEVLDGPMQHEDGLEWKFVGNHLLAQVGSDGTIAQSARYVA